MNWSNEIQQTSGSIDSSFLVQSLAFSHYAVSAVNHNSAFETRDFSIPGF